MLKGEFKEELIKIGWVRDGYNNLTYETSENKYRCQLRSRSFRIEKYVGGTWEVMSSGRYKTVGDLRLLWT